MKEGSEMVKLGFVPKLSKKPESFEEQVCRFWVPLQGLFGSHYGPHYGDAQAASRGFATLSLLLLLLLLCFCSCSHADAFA
jgi:hypothetical protein